MYTTREYIKQELSQDWAEITAAEYADDLLFRFVDGIMPVYYHEIIKDWTEMPSEYTDSWQDDGAKPEEGIIALMTSDLFNYYLDLTNDVYEELKAANE